MMIAQPPAALSLVIIAPVRLYCEALASGLSVPPFVVAGSVATVNEAVPIIERTQPHVVAIDPHGGSLFDVHEIRRLSPHSDCRHRDRRRHRSTPLCRSGRLRVRLFERIDERSDRGDARRDEG